MAPRRIASGQGVAVSVAILTAATLVMAIALYSYFTSHYSEANLESRIELLKTRILGSLSYSITHSTSEQIGHYWVGCYVVKMHNRGDMQVRLYYTVAPVEVSGTSILPGANISTIPVDQHAGEPTVFVYLLEDLDSDGIVDTVGYSGGVKVKVEPSPLTSCSAIASNATLKSLSIQPSVNATPDRVLMEDLTLEALLQVHAGSLAYPLPLWSVYMEPGDSMHLLVVVVSPYGAPSDLDYLVLAGLDAWYMYVDSFDLE